MTSGWTCMIAVTISLGQTLEIPALENGFEERLEGRHTSCDDSGIEFHNEPDGQTSAVPKEVSRLSIIDDRWNPQYASQANEHTQRQHDHDCNLCSFVHLETPQYRDWNHHSEHKISQDVECSVGESQRLQGLRSPAISRNRRVPLHGDLLALSEECLQNFSLCAIMILVRTYCKGENSVYDHKDHDALNGPSPPFLSCNSQ